MSVPLSHAAGGVTGDLLHQPQVPGLVIEASERRMPQHVWMNVPTDAGLPGQARYQFSNITRIEGLTWLQLAVVT